MNRQNKLRIIKKKVNTSRTAGRNGCGKSTFLTLLCAICFPQPGRVPLDSPTWTVPVQPWDKMYTYNIRNQQIADSVTVLSVIGHAASGVTLPVSVIYKTESTHPGQLASNLNCVESWEGATGIHTLDEHGDVGD